MAEGTENVSLESVKQFATLIGVNESQFELLVAKEKPEGFDVEALATTYKDTQHKLFENSLDKESLFKDQLDQKFKIHRETVSTKIAKGLGLNFTRKEAAEIPWEEMITKGKEHLSKQIDAAGQSSDEELRNTLKAEQEKFLGINNDYQEYREKIKVELEEKEKGYQNSIRNLKVGLKFNDEFDTVQWGIPDAQISKWKKELQNEIMENYHVNEDGTLTGKNGTHAESHDKKGIYSHIKEPLSYLMDKYQLLKKSYGQPAGDGPVIGKAGVYLTSKMSEKAQAMLKRAQAQQ